MARVEIEMTDKFVFETEMLVRVKDLNYTNHVGYDAFISLTHEARIRFLAHFGYASEMDIGGKGLLVSDLAAVYKSVVFYGDKLKFEVGVGEFNKYGCDIFYKVSRVKDGTTVLLAKNGIIFYDYVQNKVAAVPEIFLKQFS